MPEPTSTEIAGEERGKTSHKYVYVSKKGAGAFSDVITAQCVQTGEYAAIKRMKATFKSLQQVAGLREIQALRRLADQPFSIRLQEILFDHNTGRLALVFELMEMNLYELIKGRKYHLPEASIKWYMWQLLHAVRIAHSIGIFHRDIKPENILLDAKDNLKLSDFGSCRGIYTELPYTEYISTRWYRSPECLLTDGTYGPEMDIFGVGCVMFEVTALFPLFPGKDELDQINRIHAILGTPSREVLQRIRKGVKNNPIKGDFAPQKGSGLAKLIPHASPVAVDLIHKMLEYDPQRRITAEQALKHPFFADVLDIVRTKVDTMPEGTLEKLGISLDGPNPSGGLEGSTRKPSDAQQRESVAISEDAKSRQLTKRPQKTPPGAKRLQAPQPSVADSATPQDSHNNQSTNRNPSSSKHDFETVPKLPSLTRTPPARSNHGLTNVVIQASNSAQPKLAPQQTKMTIGQSSLATKYYRNHVGATSISVSGSGSQASSAKKSSISSGTHDPSALPSLGHKASGKPQKGSVSPMRDASKRPSRLAGVGQ